MIIDREDLIDILLAVKPGVATSDNTSEFATFVFTGTDICTFNDLISVSCPFETDFTALVNANLLFKILSTMSGKQVDITLEDEEKAKLKIKTTGAEANISLGMEEAEIYGILEKHNAIKKKWKPMSKDFLDGANLCLLSATTDETQGPYTCIKVHGSKIITADGIGNKTSTFLMETEMDPFLIKKSAADALNKSGLDVKQYCVTENWVFFQTEEGVVFSTKIWGGEFLDWDKVFDDIQGQRVKIPDELPKAINLASLVTKDEAMDKAVDIRLKDDLLICSAQTEKGKIVVKREVKYDKDIIDFAINPLFLQELLTGKSKMKSMIIGDKQVIFRSGSFYHCIAMRI